MLSLNRAILIVTSLLLALMVAGPQAASAAPPTPPLVTQVTVSFASNTVSITGTNFFTFAAPTVSLGGTGLTVNSYTATEIVAALPADIAPGDYLLTVSMGVVRLSYDLTIGPRIYTNTDTTETFVRCNGHNDILITGGAICPCPVTSAVPHPTDACSVLKSSYPGIFVPSHHPEEGSWPAWFANCYDPVDPDNAVFPDKIFVQCYAMP